MRGYLGNSIAAQRTRKNRIVWIKKPVEVGHPPLSAISTSHPSPWSVILNVSGFAIMKKIIVE